VFHALVAGMVIANVALVMINLPLAGVWVRLLSLPMGVLVALIVTVSTLGVYAQSRLAFDVYLMVAFGIAGYALRRGGFPLAPIVFGAVLGPLFEDNLRRAFLHAHEDAWQVLGAPLVLPCLAAIVLLVSWRARWQPGRVRQGR
jgi:putative tricarboxylic transport membrane protein